MQSIQFHKVGFPDAMARWGWLRSVWQAAGSGTSLQVEMKQDRVSMSEYRGRQHERRCKEILCTGLWLPIVQLELVELGPIVSPVAGGINCYRVD